MKKILYILLGISLLSCSSTNDDITNVTEEVQTSISPPEKGYAFYVDSPFTPIGADAYYKFIYSNGNLTEISGKAAWLTSGYLFDTLTSLSYEGYKVTVSYSWFPGVHPIYTRYTMKDGKPLNAEYSKWDEVKADYIVYQRKSYTYEKNKIKIEISKKGVLEEEISTVTYYFNDANNLIKSEEIKKMGGVDAYLTTTVYSDFDKAGNPFKKFGLVNDILYEKSLSVNNFRKSESTEVYLLNPNNPPFVSLNVNFYKYDSNGQVMLYHPL